MINDLQSAFDESINNKVDDWEALAMGLTSHSCVEHLAAPASLLSLNVSVFESSCKLISGEEVGNVCEFSANEIVGSNADVASIQYECVELIDGVVAIPSEVAADLVEKDAVGTQRGRYGLNEAPPLRLNDRSSTRALNVR